MPQQSRRCRHAESLAQQRPIAVVTGASSGIGAAIAQRLACDGYDVLIQFSGNASGAAQSAQDVVDIGGRAITCQLNFERVMSAQDFWGPLSAALKDAGWQGPVRALVLNAGVDLRQDFEQYSHAQIQRIFQVNTFVPMLALQGARTGMTSGGAIVVTSSTGARSPIATSVPYSMSKAAVNMLVAAGAGQLLDAGIRVNAVAPGIVDTPLQTRERIAAMSEQGAVGSPQDIARVASFLASDDSGWVNGQVLEASGGY